MVLINKFKVLINYILGRRLSGIMTHEELQKKFKLYAENRPVIKLNQDKVPNELHDLIYLAEKWGIGDDIIRYDFGSKSPIEDRLELVEKLKGRDDQIQKWVSSFEKGSDMTDEAVAFMYMTIASEEIDL